MEKLDWMNKQYLMSLPVEDIVHRTQPFLKVPMNDVVERAIAVERSRVSRLTEFDDAVKPYLFLAEYDRAILVWKKADVADAIAQLTRMELLVAAFSEESCASIALLEAAIKEYITREGLQNGNVLWPLRVALSGQEKSATPFETLWVLGKEESLRRIQVAIALLKT
jgi:glutamyl-tRNA synthetase